MLRPHIFFAIYYKIEILIMIKINIRFLLGNDIEQMFFIGSLERVNQTQMSEKYNVSHGKASRNDVPGVNYLVRYSIANTNSLILLYNL